MLTKTVHLGLLVCTLTCKQKKMLTNKGGEIQSCIKIKCLPGLFPMDLQMRNREFHLLGLTKPSSISLLTFTACSLTKHIRLLVHIWS